ncbi:VCBS repeat-containing protein [Hathewaya limosa]|uniref:VCBS repeat-containing protein n=1 Tax=Hathewaya limosa TaxID=1536 RepID=A0ABU0JTW5_HATLI|nr:VCBS repeat-containing protein [Hathewaya limosa]MDQ0480545.1 hypothetical protein [Hathewaya limosa]
MFINLPSNYYKYEERYNNKSIKDELLCVEDNLGNYNVERKVQNKGGFLYSPCTSCMKGNPLKQDFLKGYVIIKSEFKDVTGDGFLDYIYLVGKNYPGALEEYKDDIHLFVVDGKTQKLYEANMKTNSGYDPRLFLGDFTGDGIDEVMVSMASGGSGGFYFYYIFSFKNGIVTKMFDYEEFSNRKQYTVKYKDNYKVEILSTDNKEKYSIDISNRSKDYLYQFYDSNGRVITSEQGEVTELNSLLPIYPSWGEERFELLAIQRVIGTFSADQFGFLQSILSWDDKKDFEVIWSEVSIVNEE